jgi:hypothetical protein
MVLNFNFYGFTYIPFDSSVDLKIEESINYIDENGYSQKNIDRVYANNDPLWDNLKGQGSKVGLRNLNIKSGVITLLKSHT